MILADNLKAWIFQRYLKKRFFFYSTNDAEDLNKIFRLRYEVYCLEKKYLNANDYPSKIETDKYDPYSVFFIVKDKKNGQLAGTVRLIKKKSHELPLESEFGVKIDKENDNGRMLEVSRLIVAKDYRKSAKGQHYVLFLLFRMALNYCIDYDYNILVAELDNRILQILKKIGIEFKVLGKAKMFMGSVSTPILINIQKGIENLKRKNYLLWKILTSK